MNDIDQDIQIAIKHFILPIYQRTGFISVENAPYRDANNELIAASLFYKYGDDPELKSLVKTDVTLTETREFIFNRSSLETTSPSEQSRFESILEELLALQYRRPYLMANNKLSNDLSKNHLKDIITFNEFQESNPDEDFPYKCIVVKGLDDQQPSDYQYTYDDLYLVMY
jgi:hypothetical protein